MTWSGPFRSFMFYADLSLLLSLLTFSVTKQCGEAEGYLHFLIYAIYTCHLPSFFLLFRMNVFLIFLDITAFSFMGVDFIFPALFSFFSVDYLGLLILDGHVFSFFAFSLVIKVVDAVFWNQVL